MLDLAPNALAALTARLHELGWLPQQTTLVSAETAGDGNMNRTLRVHTDGNPSTLILKQSVPFVAKYPEIPAPIERAAAEAEFYAAIAPTPCVQNRTPSLIGYDAANYLLAFEDLGAGSDQLALYRQSTPIVEVRALTQPLIEWITHLHAISPPVLANHAMRELNHTHIFSLPLQLDNAIELGELTGLATELANNTQLIQRARELGAVYLGQATHRSQPVLLHGDFYPGGWLTDSRGNIRVIDAEFCFVGPAEFDVGVMLAHLLFSGLRWSDAQELCAAYQTPAGFEPELRDGFAGMEVIRRLLGVAQLPLAASTAQKTDWLQIAQKLVTGASN